MIVTENITINGKAFVKTYSDAGYMIEREGALYSEAIDPAEFKRVFLETDTLIDGTEEATKEDYLAALGEMGVQL